MKQKILLTITCLLPCVGNAAVLLDFDGAAPTANTQARTDDNLTIGNRFTVGSSDLRVTELGAMDVNNTTLLAGTNGFVAPISVGIWDLAGNLLASVSALSTSTQGADGYRYVALDTALILTAGTQYYIGAHVGSGREYFLDDNSAASFFASNTDITLNSSSYGTGFVAPTTATGTVGRWAPANAVFTAVPEPSAALLGGLGLLALLRRRR